MINLSKSILLFIVVTLFSCNTTKTGTDVQDLIYADKVKDLNPQYIVYHHEEEKSLLYFELKSKELLYVRENISQPFTSTISIFYKLYNLEDKRTLVDSATNLLVDKKKSNTFKRIIGKIPIPIQNGAKYKLEILTVDINKKVEAKTEIYIDKQDSTNRQFFLVEKPNQEICFSSFFTQSEEIQIRSHFNQNISLKVDYYNENLDIAKPPFSDQNEDFTFNEQSDSFDIVELKNGEAKVFISEKGNYLFSVNNKKSFLLNYIDENFPEVIDYEGMIEPIRYICTNKEYENLIAAEDKRKAVEEFWLRLGGNKERAKILIREYYRRIYLANKYFTSYKEGWRTDRGMLSIVMGYPNTINTGSKGETWIYGTASNMMMSLTFNFDKLNTEYIPNDLQLDRYRTYKDYWYRAVENWRQGRVYSFN